MINYNLPRDKEQIDNLGRMREGVQYGRWGRVEGKQEKNNKEYCT